MGTADSSNGAGVRVPFSPALHRLMVDTISSFIHSFPGLAQEEGDLLSMIWLKLHVRLSDPTCQLRELVAHVPYSPADEKRLRSYLWTLLRRLAVDRHHTDSLSPRLFSELDSIAKSIGLPPRGLQASASRSSPGKALEWLDSWEAFKAAIRRHFKKRGPTLIAWLESGATLKVAKRLRLPPRSLTRYRRTLRPLYLRFFPERR